MVKPSSSSILDGAEHSFNFLLRLLGIWSWPLALFVMRIRKTLNKQ